jgi:Carbohydrate esterase 2 N-terminal
MTSERLLRLRVVLGSLVLAVSIGARAETARTAAEVQVIGRAERSIDGWRVTWPGVGWRTAFSGSSVGVATQDAVGYSVTIDGIRKSPILPSPTRQTSWYRGLTAGSHTIEVIRMRGTPRTPGLFVGFDIGAADRWLPLAPSPTRQIEFIADSGATGYGDLSTTSDCGDDDVAPRSDASQSYPVLAAHALRADWQLDGVDGIGLVRNWHGIWKGTNYVTYAGRTLQSDAASRYDDSNWRPQVVVVRIGQNDLGSPVESGESWTAVELDRAFTDGYRKLLMELRGRLGPHGLIVVLQPAFDDNPANAKVADVVDSLRSGGDQRLYRLEFPKLELTGCNSHPNLADHRVMSDALVKFIESHGGP